MTKSRQIESSSLVTGRISAKTYSTEELQRLSDNWKSLSKEEKLKLTKQVEPIDEEIVTNVTTERFHEYFVDNLDINQTGSKTNITGPYLALGNSASGGTSTTDVDLNNRVYSESVTSTADNGTELLTSTFLESTDGNGYDYDELGLFSNDPSSYSDPANFPDDVFLMNHATFTDVTKDNTKTVTFDVTLIFSDG